MTDHDANARAVYRLQTELERLSERLRALMGRPDDRNY